MRAWEALTPAAREERIADLDIACTAAGTLYPHYDTFGQRTDGTYFITADTIGKDNGVIEFVPKSSAITYAIESAVA